VSLDLFQRETDEHIARQRPVQVSDPGVFDNFISGAGMAAMRTFAKAGRAASMAAGGAVAAVEKLGSLHPLANPGDTSLSDSIFRAHDETMQRAVDYWTPKPGEVGAAGEVVGQLLATLPMVVASPALTVAQTQLAEGEDLVRKGVDAGTANTVGAVQAAGLGLGIWMPILGKTLAQRVLAGGAGFNVVQGVVTRGVSGALLEGTPAEKDYAAFDPAALTLDILLGAAFGGLAHLSPAQRAQGEAVWKQIETWGKTVPAGDVDAIAALRQAQHLNVDSMPGKPVTEADIEAHVERMRTAIGQAARGEPVSVENMPRANVEPDGRFVEAEARARDLVAEAEKVRADEGLPNIETEGPPSRGSAEPPRSAEAGTAGLTARDGEPVDPLAAAARRVATERPDLTIAIGTDAEGKPVTMTAAEFVENARRRTAEVEQDARLFEVAATCMFGGR